MASPLPPLALCAASATLAASVVGDAAAVASSAARAVAEHAQKSAEAFARLEKTPCRDDDMVLVDGAYCTEATQTCLHWLDKDQMRCARFAPTTCTGDRRKMRFCVDRYEFPNQAGEKPQVQID